MLLGYREMSKRYKNKMNSTNDTERNESFAEDRVRKEKTGNNKR